MKQLLFRILVVVIVAGTVPGLGSTVVRGSPAGEVYTVTYDGNGNDGGSVPVDIMSYEQGDSAIVHDNSKGLTKNGFIFGGWNTAADGSGTDYIAGATLPMGTDNVILYAKWINPIASWSLRSPLTNELNNIAFGNGVFSAVGNSGVIVSSGDGTLWTKQTSGTAKHLYGITGGEGKFVAVGASGAVLTSDDNATWISQTSGTSKNLHDVIFANGMFMSVGVSGTIISSSNGDSWSSVTSGSTYNRTGIAYGNVLFVSVGYLDIVTSTNGTNWTTYASPAYLYGIAYGNGMFVAVGTSGGIYSSANGAIWKKQTSNTQNTLNGIAYGNGFFVAVGNSGTILTSSNGADWTAQTSSITNHLYGVTYGNDKFVAVGMSGAVVYSDDGVDWTVTDTGEKYTLRAVAYRMGKYVAVGLSFNTAGVIFISEEVFV